MFVVQSLMYLQERLICGYAISYFPGFLVRNRILYVI
jgi:hypothetical protein